ncbi:MAG TPA: rod shape-determining protein MreD [Negativicutes bacterium]|jgi:rod shape-determining protein MreD
MRGIIWAGVIIVALILQSTIIPLLAVNGIRPDLLLIIVVSSGLLSGKEHGVGIGFFSGLLQDLVSGNIFGLNILAKLATGYVFGMAERKVFKEHILLPVLAMAVATVFHGAVILVLLVMFGYKVAVVPTFLHSTLPQVVYNVVVAIPVHQLIYRLNKIK